MSLSVGDRLGAYEILAPLGAGGMGEVFRAIDTRLHREVAIKISAEQFTERFEREARVIASLNHPNICTLYDVGPNYLVMELVEGPTLADRIKRGALPIEETLAIAGQIANALEAAHERGVIHRDLKPANIKVTPDSTVKVLDFGLAKASEDLSDNSASTNSPTLTISPTRAGMILGTAPYMAPEQARGKSVDKRADIWAFGCVVYEMVTGNRAFEGETTSDILASVLKEEPHWSRIPARVLPLLRRCLAKDPKQRLRDIGDAMPLLEKERPAMESVPSRSRLGWVWPGAAALLAVSLAAVSLVHFREMTPAPQMLRYTIDAPAKTRITNFAISPDGRYVALTATGDRSGQLWIRPLDSLQAQPLAVTEGATYPFCSPDSRYIGFFAENKLKKISRAGDPRRPTAMRLPALAEPGTRTI